MLCCVDAVNPKALKAELVEKLDYELIPGEVFAKLQQWYGGGPAFLRNVIVQGELVCSLLCFCFI